MMMQAPAISLKAIAVDADSTRFDVCCRATLAKANFSGQRQTCVRGLHG